MGLRTSIVRAVVRRPWLLPAAMGLAWASRERGWYRRPPFLPLPPSEYLRWRTETAYGELEGDPPEEEVVRYLLWARRMRRDH